MPNCPRCNKVTKGNGFCQPCAAHFAAIKVYKLGWNYKRRGGKRKKKVTLAEVKSLKNENSSSK